MCLEPLNRMPNAYPYAMPSLSVNTLGAHTLVKPHTVVGLQSIQIDKHKSTQLLN